MDLYIALEESERSYHFILKKGDQYLNIHGKSQANQEISPFYFINLFDKASALRRLKYNIFSRQSSSNLIKGIEYIQKECILMGYTPENEETFVEWAESDDGLDSIQIVRVPNHIGFDVTEYIISIYCTSKKIIKNKYVDNFSL
ncbi:hypothetical protein [Neptuniibacter sp.]|uniref:hypothetical protein n=1 Tax=Neptuniibacter sp. TaxID=1962643 RepID=UPI003B58C952